MKKKLKHLIEEIKTVEAKLAELKKQAANFSILSSEKETEELTTLNNEDLLQYKEKLQEKERLIQKTEEFSKVGRWTYIFKTATLEWSDETYKIFEYPESFEGTLREYYIACLDEKTAARLPEESQKIRASKENVLMNQTICTPQGNTKLLSFTSSPIFNENDEIVGVEGFVKDLSDQITGKNGLNNFFNLSNDLHCIVHMDKYFVKVSPAWTKLLGFSEKELLSCSYLDFVHPDDLEKTKLTAHDLDDVGSISVFENRYITKSGEVVYLSWNSRLDEDTQLAYCTARDITKSKLAQDELLSDLSEKDLLLREIHHRVKNNLQIISSLLSLQAGANSNHEQLIKLYEDSQNRINSMAAIHEMFYQSEEMDKIEFGKYLDKLISDLSNSFTSEKKSIELVLNVEPVFVDLDTAIPLGLLINEVVTNSIKHGADEHGHVKISVELETLENGSLRLIIGDNGTNNPTDILNQMGDSLGIMLINSLVEQIGGEIIQRTDLEGTVYQLIFSEGKR